MTCSWVIRFYDIWDRGGIIGILLISELEFISIIRKREMGNESEYFYLHLVSFMLMS